MEYVTVVAVLLLLWRLEVRRVQAAQQTDRIIAVLDRIYVQLGDR